jgi:hypothetical protein
MKDVDSAPGSFSWLRWNKGANSAPELAEMLADDGNMDKGVFEEAPWPSDVTKAGEPAPKGYPLDPGGLTNGDWVYGNPGMSKSSAVESAIRDHINKRTVMILPIVSRASGSGNNAAYEVVTLGSFYIVDPTPNDSRSGGFNDQGGSNAYIDLVYLGPVKETACLQTNVVPPNDTQQYGILGEIRIKPTWRQGSKPALPVAYTVVLDVSGSMTQDFAGHNTIGGTRPKEANVVGGTDVQCGTEKPIPGDALPWDPNCQSGGQNAVWRYYQERRIFVAKNAIYQFIDRMGQYDRMRFITFSTDGQGSGNAKSHGNWNMTSKAEFQQTIKNAGMYNNDPYWTAGGTPGAQALNAAKDILSRNDVPQVAPDGKPYKRVLLYITDGLANVMLNGQTNYADDICGEINPPNVRLSTPKCQMGYRNGTTPRPIQAMIDIAEDMREADPNLTIYAIALADANTAGLGSVASDPSLVFKATDPAAVPGVFNDIYKDVKEGTCTPVRDSTYYDKIAQQNFGQIPGQAPLPDGVYGYVYIYDKTHQHNDGKAPLKKLPIVADTRTGKLSYYLPAAQGLPGDQYTLEAYVQYRTIEGDKGDGQTRIYRWIMPPTNAGAAEGDILSGSYVRSFNVSGANTLSREFVMDRIDLQFEPSLNACLQ